MLDFHWIKAMLFFLKYYDFLQFFLHRGIFFPAYRLGKFVQSLKQYFIWQIPLTSMVYFYIKGQQLEAV